MPRPKAARIAEFFRRLHAHPAARDFQEAWRQIETTLNQVEDELSGVPFNPDAWRSDGRLYPPRLDSERRLSGHPNVRRFRHVGHNTLIRENGAIQIRVANSEPLAGEVLFSKGGADGREVLDP
ncbi:MAG: hypothetical protein HYZ53_14635 [Planctomycetes bacterium]|nr:hypothetical protein [Planctomycetota bacterium]